MNDRSHYDADNESPKFSMFLIAILLGLALLALWAHDSQVCAQRGGHLVQDVTSHGWECSVRP